MKLALTREQRAAFFRGQPPTIKGEGKCPVEPGYVHELSPKLSFTVVGIRKPQRGGWSLEYEVSDRRDVPRLLRRVPPAHDFGKDRQDRVRPPSEADVRAAAQESAYTGSHYEEVPDGAEEVDEFTQRRFTQQAELNAGQEAELAQARRERHSLIQRIMRLEHDARMRGVDISSQVRVIERQVAKAERRVHRGKAA